MKLLSPASANTKTRKSAEKAKEYSIVSLMLAPADSAGGRTVCSHSTRACEKLCVGGDGIGLAQVFKAIGESRRQKTNWYNTDRAGFMKQLESELETEQRLADREGTTLCGRLNCFSDLNWFSLIRRFPNAVFYDYAKNLQRIVSPEKPENYWLTGSWTENKKNQRDCIELLRKGENIAIAFADLAGNFVGNRALNQRIPKTWTLDGTELQVLDGDDSDLRMLDKRAKPGKPGYIVGLRLKSGSSEQRRESIESGFCQLIE
jgi:hypothetical protein